MDQYPSTGHESHSVFPGRQRKLCYAMLFGSLLISALAEFALEAHKHSCLRQSRAKTASSSVPDKHSNYGAGEIPWAHYNYNEHGKLDQMCPRAQAFVQCPFIVERYGGGNTRRTTRLFMLNGLSATYILWRIYNVHPTPISLLLCACSKTSRCWAEQYNRTWVHSRCNGSSINASQHEWEMSGRETLHYFCWLL